MKRVLLLGPIFLLCGLLGCSRTGVIDATGATTARGGTPKSPTPARIAHGATVDLQNYIVPGKTTIFDFTSEGCPPCRAIAPALHKLHAEHDDIVVVEVDLNRPGIRGIDWRSPVAQQFGLQSSPHFKIYGPNGKLMAEGDQAYGIVNEMLH